MAIRAPLIYYFAVVQAPEQSSAAFSRDVQTLRRRLDPSDAQQHADGVDALRQNYGLSHLLGARLFGTVVDPATNLEEEWVAIGNGGNISSESLTQELGALNARLRALPSEDPSAERLAQQVLSKLGNSLAEHDTALNRLLEFAGQRFSPGEVTELRRHYGASPMDAATLRLLYQLSSTGGYLSRALRLDGTIEIGAPIMRARSAAAVLEVFRMPYSSIDRVGAANVDHLITVLEGVVRAAHRSAGRPLDGDTLDILAIETLLTDAAGKGRTPNEIRDLPTAPLTDTRGRAIGNTGQEFWSFALKHDVHESWPRELSGDPSVVEAINRLFETHLEPTSQHAELAAAQLTPAQSTEFRAVWRTLETAPVTRLIKQGYLAGVLAHGLPSFELISRAVEASGRDKTAAQRVYETVLGHHMAGFIAFGLHRVGVRVDFDALVSAGHLTGHQGMRLSRLYDAAIDLASRWRPTIDEAMPGGHGLSQSQRADYAADAAELRNAIAVMPDYAQWQYICDDTQQFTVIGMPKWLRMYAGLPPPPKTNGDLIDKIYALPVQSYYEENLARGTGDAFRDASLACAGRLGMVWDARGAYFRGAKPGEAGYGQFAQRLTADPSASGAFASEPSHTSVDIVAWFRARPQDAEALVRIISD